MPGKNLTRTEAAIRAELLTVDSYDVSLDLTTGEKTFRTTTTVTFSAASGAATFIDALTASVFSVQLNGKDLDPADVADGTRIQLPDLQDNNELTIVADMFYTNTGEGLHRFVDPVDGEIYLYSQFEVADTRRMFPVFEQPDLKSRFTFTVTAPAHWQVISNQPTPEPTPVNDQVATWAFTPTAVIPPYIAALVAGPYEVSRDHLVSADGRSIPLGIFARKSLMEYVDIDEIFTITKQGFAFYESQFGCVYPFEKYDQLFVPQFNAGAMENAGCVTFSETYVFRSRPPQARVERRATTILHELAHMWFGNLVTMRWWNDLWLNESFAEYASTLAQAQVTRYTDAWTTFAAMEKSWGLEQDQLPTTHPIKAEIKDLEDVLVNFDGITYAKGASVLKQLVAWVGQEQFMKGLRTYFAKYGWGNAELSDLMAELETASGRDLKNWGALWLETAGVNTLRPECVRDDDNVITSFDIVQTAPEKHPFLRPHRIAIGFYDVDEHSGQLVRTHRLETDIDGSRTEIPELIGQEAPDLVLVNDDDLAYTKIRLDEYSQDTVTEHLKDFAEPLPRTLVWQAAWDGVHDATSAPRGYVHTVLNNISFETDSTVVLVQLRHLDTVLTRYICPQDRSRMTEETAEQLWALVQSAEPGSDNQLQFVRAYARHATTAQQCERVEALESGQLVLDGLNIDTDLRWAFIIALAAAGRADQKVIDTALAQDNTEHGAIAAAQARAAIPTAEAKAETWAMVVEHGSMPNSLQGAAIAGFQQTVDPDLLQPYISEYFRVIEDTYRNRSHEIAEQIAVGLFPKNPDPTTIETVDEFLSQLPEDLNGLRRLILEGKDRMLRALAAQKLDAESSQQ